MTEGKYSKLRGICQAKTDVIREQCMWNDKGNVVIEEIMTVWREHYEQLLNEVFDWNKENLSDEPLAGTGIMD